MKAKTFDAILRILNVESERQYRECRNTEESKRIDRLITAFAGEVPREEEP